MNLFNCNRKRHQIKLFHDLYSKQQIKDAQLVGKNLFCNRPADTEIFCMYFDFCIEQAENQKDTNSGLYYLNEADFALALFIERCEILEDTLVLIDDKRKKISDTDQTIRSWEHENEEDFASQINANNDVLISKLEKLADKIQNTTNQDEFDIVIAEVSDSENSLQKESFTEQQNEKYNAISKRYSKLVSAKMRELQWQNDKDYNLQAAESIKRVYDSFKNDEKKYKKDMFEFRILINDLCRFDNARLFSETIMYYNFVYSYIFNAMDEQMKLKMTEYAINNNKD